MRILFDHNVPDPLRQSFLKHSVQTSSQLGWGQLINGALLQAAEVNGFDLMVTADQNLRYQQNLKARKIALVVIGSNRWPHVKEHLPKIMTAVEASSPGSYIFIEVPLPPKPKRRL